MVPLSDEFRHTGGFSMRARLVAVIIATCTGVVACSEPPQAGGIERLTGDQFCRMLPKESVEKQFPDMESLSIEGKVDGRGITRATHCHYNGGIDLALISSVSRSIPRSASSSAEDQLDSKFSDLDGKVISYKRIDGLGAAAGYGGPVGARDAELVVIFDIGSERYELELTALSKARLGQLKPLVEELLPRVQNVLR